MDTCFIFCGIVSSFKVELNGNGGVRFIRCNQLSSLSFSRTSLFPALIFEVKERHFIKASRGPTWKRILWLGNLLYSLFKFSDLYRMFLDVIQTSDVRSFFKEGKLQPWDLGFADWEYLLWDLAAPAALTRVLHCDLDCTIKIKVSVRWV